MNFFLTTPDGQIDHDAVAAYAARIEADWNGQPPVIGKVPAWSCGEMVVYDLIRETRTPLEIATAKAEIERAHRLHDIASKREAAAFEADCQALAINYRFDVASLQFERDRYFWGNSTSRPIQLPRYERALKIAQDHAAKAAKAKAA